jgi:uncharacterized repeat protein (TIGR01451 family)
MRRTARTGISLSLTSLLVLALAGPAAAQEASDATASAFGIEVLGIIEPTPDVASNLGDEDQSETVVDIPAEPLVQSATVTAEAQTRAEPELEALLQEKMEAVAGDLPDLWNARGYAVTEDLEALDGNLTADLIAAEAVASCVDGELTLATGSEFQNVTLGGEEIPLDQLDEILGEIGTGLRDNFDALFGETTLLVFSDQPNDVVLDVPELGIRIIAWETNWDGETGTTDGSDTVWVNALRISIDEDSPLRDLYEGLEPLLGEEPVDITISRAEATADCSAAAVPGDPLGDVTKTASSDTVAPGDTFTYTIDVPNSDDTCTLTDVAVVDTITGPGTVTATDPEADSVERDGDVTTVTYADIGPIEPGDSVTITIDVEVDDDAAAGTVFAEELRITADCDGEVVEGGLDFDGPTVAAPGPGEPVTPGAPAAPDTVPAGTLPATGGIFGVVALLALAGAYGLRRSRISG